MRAMMQVLLQRSCFQEQGSERPVHTSTCFDLPGPVTAVPSSAGNMDSDESRRAEQTAQPLGWNQPTTEVSLNRIQVHVFPLFVVLKLVRR